MEEVDVKAELKAARESIRTKEFKDVLRRCKLILKADKDNYNAYVFLGVAAEGLEQPAQAEQAYRKATQLAPKQATAWQGLQKLYEKGLDPQHKVALPEVYGGLAACYEALGIAEKDKYLDAMVKRADAFHMAGSTRDALVSLSALLSPDKGLSSADMTRMRCKMIDLAEIDVSKGQSGDSDVRRMYEESLDVVDLAGAEAGLVESATLVKHRKSLLRLLLTRLKATVDASSAATVVYRIRTLCASLQSADPADPFAFEVSCALGTNPGLSGSAPSREEKRFAVRFAFMYPQNAHALLSLGHVLVRVGIASDRTVRLLSDGVKRLPNLALGWLYYAECCLARKDSDGAGNAARRGISLLTSPAAAAPTTTASQSSGGVVVLSSAKTQTVQVSTNADMNPTGNNTLSKLELLLAATFVMEGNRQSLSQARAFYERILSRHPGEPAAVVGLARTCIARGENDAAAELLSQIPSDSSAAIDAGAMSGYLALVRGDADAAIAALCTAVSARAINAEYRLWLARAYWSKGGEFRSNKAYCQAEAMAAGRLDPFLADAFALLGDLFRDEFADAERARRCYWKAVRVDPRCDSAGIALSELLGAMGDEDGLLELYKAMTAKKGRSIWAWLRLGLHYQSKGRHADAIEHFQGALRIDTTNARLWEALADSYAASGRLIAATKAFARANELDPSDFCTTRIAMLNTTLGMTSPAIQSLEELLQRRPDYIPGEKALADALLAHARQRLSLGMVPRAVSYLERCVRVVSAALAREPLMRTLWKIAGDACMTLALCPDESLAASSSSLASSCSLNPPAFPFASPDSGVGRHRPPLPPSIGTSVVDLTSGVGVACCAARMYAECVALQRGAAEHWHDLACAVSTVADLLGGAIGIADDQHDDPAVNRARVYAIECCKTGLRLTPEDHRLWLLYGVLECAHDNPAVAQHALVRSINLCANNAPAWANLGLLYWAEGLTEQAHAAFSRAQSVDPTHSLAWVGQALVAERIGHEDEAADLFRHSSELDPTMTRANFGYASHAYAKLRDAPADPRDPLARFRGLLQSATAMARVLDRTPRDALAHNYAGLLLEAAGRHSEARARFATCRSLSAGNRALLGAACINEGRVLNRLNRPSEALAVLADVHEAGYKVAVAKGRAHFLLGMYAESGQSYEAALAAAVVEDVSASDRAMRIVDATIGVAQSAYYAGDYMRARQLLIDCAPHSSEHPRGLYVLVAMAVLQGDQTIAMAALGELLQRNNDSLDDLGRIDAVLLFASAFQTQGHSREAGRFIARLVHMFPHSWRLWHRLSTHLLYGQQSTVSGPWYGDCGKLGLRTALSSLATFQSHPHADTDAEDAAWSEDAVDPHALVSAAFLAAGMPPHASGAAQRALSAAEVAAHSDPSNVGSWVALSAAALATSTLERAGAQFSVAMHPEQQGGGGWEERGGAFAGLLAAQASTAAAHAKDASQRKLAELSPGSASVAGVENALPVHAAAFNAYAPALARVALWARLAALDVHTSGGNASLLGQIDQSIGEVIGSNPLHASKLYVQLGRALLSYPDGSQERATAPAAFKNALRLDVHNADAWQELAQAYALNDRPKSAEMCLRMCVETAPSDAKAARTLPMMRIARLALYTKNKELAIEAVSVAMQLDRTNSAVAALAGIVHSVLGDARSARRSLSSAVDESDRAVVDARKMDRIVGRSGAGAGGDISRELSLYFQAKTAAGGKDKDTDAAKSDPVARMSTRTPLYALARK